MVLDVVTIEKSGEHFRLLYDVKGRFTIHNRQTGWIDISINMRDILKLKV